MLFLLVNSIGIKSQIFTHIFKAFDTVVCLNLQMQVEGNLAAHISNHSPLSFAVPQLQDCKS